MLVFVCIFINIILLYAHPIPICFASYMCRKCTDRYVAEVDAILLQVCCKFVVSLLQAWLNITIIVDIATTFQIARPLKHIIPKHPSKTYTFNGK